MEPPCSHPKCNLAIRWGSVAHWVRCKLESMHSTQNLAAPEDDCAKVPDLLPFVANATPSATSCSSLQSQLNFQQFAGPQELERNPRCSAPTESWVPESVSEIRPAFFHSLVVGPRPGGPDRNFVPVYQINPPDLLAPFCTSVRSP